MKLFAVVALCCSFFSTRATPLPFEFSDCDDPDVLEAVDTALQKYNGESVTGNQFALYTVMEAKRTVGPDKQLYVKYQIRETTCGTEENKLWKDCDYKAPAEAKTGECTAQVHMNYAEKTRNVSQDCKIVPAISSTREICLGCFHAISSDESQVLEIVKEAIRRFNKHSGEAVLFKLVGITEAQRQVVAGWNYKIKYEIKETNCSTEQFQDLTHECRTTSEGRTGKCDAKAYENIKAVIVDIESQCNFPAAEVVNPPTHTCPGCPSAIPTDSAELKELLQVSVEKYNSETDDDFYYKAGQIESATVQVVAGQNYNLIFFLRKTNCSKKEFEKLNEDCEAAIGSLTLRCEAQIYVVQWENKIFPQVNCTEYQTAATLLRMPSGFTPLRSFIAEPQVDETPSPSTNEGESQIAGEEEVREDDRQEPDDRGEPDQKRRHKHGHGLKKDHEFARRHGQEIDCGHRNGHRCGHRKHGKNGKHKHHKPESSEESRERIFSPKETLPSSTEAGLGLIKPQVVRTETGTPTEHSPDTSSFNGLSDHTESPRPKCPGKPWKPILDLPVPSSLSREFINEDLLPSVAENIDLTTENPPPPQKERKSLDLADALE